jgi:hypothetical protein
MTQQQRGTEEQEEEVEEKKEAHKNIFTSRSIFPFLFPSHPFYVSSPFPFVPSLALALSNVHSTINSPLEGKSFSIPVSVSRHPTL